MSSSNLELVRSIYAAWERGDFSETYWVDPEIDFQSIGDSPGAVAAQGLEGMKTSWREWLNAWEGFQVKAVDYREIDDERVLVLSHFEGRGRTSGLEIGEVWNKGASLFHIRDSKVIQLLLYTDHERALAELGL
jgi:ketosteroid isomerase-like protein